MKDNLKYYYVGIAIFQHKKLIKPLSFKDMITMGDGFYGIWQPTQPNRYLNEANKLLIRRLKFKYQEVLNIMDISDEEFNDGAGIYRYHIVEMQLDKYRLPVDENIYQKMWDISDELFEDYRINILQNGMKISHRPEEKILPYVSPFESTKGIK